MWKSDVSKLKYSPIEEREEDFCAESELILLCRDSTHVPPVHRRLLLELGNHHHQRDEQS